MTSCYSSFQVVIVMHSQIIKLKFRSLAIGLLLFTAVKYLFLMPNSPYSTKPLQIVDTNEEELIEDIIVQNDQTTNEILHTFAQRRDHVRNICQRNKTSVMLFGRDNCNYLCRICDFGFAKQLRADNGMLMTPCYTGW